MGPWKIRKLQSGGVITNYNCVCRCRHCLYNCSPARNKAFLEPLAAQTIFSHIRRKGCRHVHIGGGEPMLKPADLRLVLESAGRAGVMIDYVETNGAWFKNPDQAVETLQALKQAGLHTLLLSISPFHNETIPFQKTSGVMAACRKTDIQLIPWEAGFIPVLSALNESEPHELDEFETVLGVDLLAKIQKRYWIHPGGRALATYHKVLPRQNYSVLLKNNPESCMPELTSTSHFHIDLYGRYIPGLCSGLSIPMKFIGQPLDEKLFPILTRLAVGGVAALDAFARERFGFRPQQEDGYIHKCELCTEIRTFFVSRGEGGEFPELAPREFYNEWL